MQPKPIKRSPFLPASRRGAGAYGEPRNPRGLRTPRVARLRLMKRDQPIGLRFYRGSPTWARMRYPRKPFYQTGTHGL